MTEFEAGGVLEKASHPRSEKSAARATIPAQTEFWEAPASTAGLVLWSLPCPLSTPVTSVTGASYPRLIQVNSYEGR
jgi:hypothetical protein